MYVTGCKVTLEDYSYFQNKERILKRDPEYQSKRGKIAPVLNQLSTA
jgi:hypothetical protein